MKYALDPELKKIARLKLPATLKLFPPMNIILSMSRCRSDALVRVSRHRTPGYDGAVLQTLVIEPKHAEGDLPCLVFFHGGGFVLKASHAHYQIAKMYAERLPCKVVYADYRLLPKHPFPTPAEDGYHTYLWTLEHAATLHIHPDQIVIGGDSAGGNLALAVTLMARDRGTRIPRAALLIYPVTDRRMMTESMNAYTNAPVWNAKLTRLMWNAYLGRQLPERIEYASPIEAASLKDFPPTYLEVAQYDALRDDGVSLYHKLRQQGVACELHEIPGSCHGYETALQSTLLRTCMNQRITWLKSILAT